MKAFSHSRIKNDELDARDLADLLRMGRAVLVGRADPRHYESDTTVARGRITKQRSPVLRFSSALVVSGGTRVAVGLPC